MASAQEEEISEVELSPGRGAGGVGAPVAAGADEARISNPPDAASSHSGAAGEDEWLNSLASVKDGRNFRDKSQKPKIQRVPKLLREKERNKACYDPLVVSIGPFHHGKAELAPMEMFKTLLAAQYANGCKASNTDCERAREGKERIACVYKKVADLVDDARKCYTEGSTDDFSDEAFGRMMFLDGCFVLQFIHCIVSPGNAATDTKMKSHEIAFVYRDLFLLENQIPFQVLRVLMSLRFEEGEGEEKIKSFINRSKAHPDQSLSCTQKIIKKLFGRAGKPRREHLQSEEEKSAGGKPHHVLDVPPQHLLEFVRTQLVNSTASPKVGCYLKDRWCSYRSAAELRSVGIYFKPSNTSKFSDVTFKSYCISARLTLPWVIIDDSTRSLLLNLVAYEACPDTPDDFWVTSYVCFMDSLIDHAEDVMELRSHGILFNFLGSDQEVADMFNEIAKDLVPNPSAYVGVKRGIENSYKSTWMRWTAQCRRAYLRNPWTVIALAVAAVALVLSVFQTVSGAFQTYLTAYPPRNPHK